LGVGPGLEVWVGPGLEVWVGLGRWGRGWR